MSQNESNAFAFHSQRLETLKEIEIKRLDTSIVNQKTLRVLVIGGIIALPVITLLIMFYKDTFFIPWLTFLAGLAGGTGLNKVSKLILKTPEKISIDDRDD